MPLKFWVITNATECYVLSIFNNINDFVLFLTRAGRETARAAEKAADEQSAVFSDVQ